MYICIYTHLYICMYIFTIFCIYIFCIWPDGGFSLLEIFASEINDFPSTNIESFTLSPLIITASFTI